MQTWAVDEKLYRLGEDGSPCRVEVPQGYRCESDSLDMDDLACIPKCAPRAVVPHSAAEMTRAAGVSGAWPACLRVHLSDSTMRTLLLDANALWQGMLNALAYIGCAHTESAAAVPA